MRPKFEISKNNDFTVWESGRLNLDKNIGSSIIVANEDYQPCQVIYDKNNESLHQYLFHAKPGMILASSYLTMANGVFSLQLELAKINEIYTTTVQGQLVPSANIDNIYISKRNFDTLTGVSSALDSYKADPYYSEVKNNLLSLALEKSITPGSSQKLFYGIPRVKQESHDSERYYSTRST